MKYAAVYRGMKVGINASSMIEARSKASELFLELDTWKIKISPYKFKNKNVRPSSLDAKGGIYDK